MNARAWPMWWLPVVLSACAAELAREPDSGGRLDASMTDASTTDAGRDDDGGQWPTATYAPTFSAIFHETFERQLCTSVFCHGAGGLTLDFSTQRAAYDSLVNQSPTGEMCAGRGLTLVVPGDPDASLLVSKVQDDVPACGVRMPKYPGLVLSAEEIAQIRSWIERGARDD